MFIKSLCSLLLLFIFLSSPFLKADPLEEKVVEYTLSNGMKFLLVRRSGAPVFSSYIRVKVGGADETRGQTGIAHMLEHMAFKGTQKIGTRNYQQEKKILDEMEKVGTQLASLVKNEKSDSSEAKGLRKTLKLLQETADRFTVKEEFSRLYNQNGATDFNATTSKDLTSYFVTLPSSKLKLWAYLDSERLRDPVFREFYSERDVVLEERRMRVDNSPFGKNYENVLEHAFTRSPYQFPTIGYQKDIEALTATDLKKFYDTYYVPQNMVGALIGDIDIDATKKILDQSFGRIPAGSLPPQLKDEEPLQTLPRESQVFFDARPQLMMAYHKPTVPSLEDDVFDLIGQILCEGRSSRLNQALVEKQHIAQSVSCDTGTPGTRLNNLFFVYATPMGNHSTQELETSIDYQIKKIQKSGVTDEEIERAKKQLLSETWFEIRSNLGLAEALTYFQAITGDWRDLMRHEEILKKITSQKIREVAQKYLVKNNRTVSVLSREK